MDPAIKPEPPKTGVSYAMYGDGSIYRIDHENGNQKQKLATHDGESLIYVNQEARKFHMRVAMYLKEAGVEYAGTFVSPDADEVPPPAPVRRDANPVPEGNIPPPPRKNKRDGDKTPEYVEWVRKYRPQEFIERYGIQGDGTVTKFRKVPHKEIAGRYSEEPYQMPALIARRKIHLTELPQGKDDEGYAPIPAKPERI